MISSLSNPQLKLVRRLQNERRFRNREQLFVTEGTRWLQEWLAHPAGLQHVYYTADWAGVQENAVLLDAVAGAKHMVSAEVMAAMSDTENAPGVLMQATMVSLPLAEDGDFFLLLDEVTNPGNLGTMLRTAVAAGVDAVLLGPGCVDAYNPKVVRGGMGAHLRIPIYHLDWPEIGAIVHNTAVWLAEAEAETLYTDVPWSQPATLVVGNEARGPGVAARALIDGSVRIPMAAATESLNAAVAAAVILFEAARQRGFRSIS
jgi:TrmH family RNA methyltransferase